MACPSIIGPDDKLGLLVGGVREEAIFRGADRQDSAGGGRRHVDEGRVPEAQRLGAVVLPLEGEVRRHGCQRS